MNVKVSEKKLKKAWFGVDVSKETFDASVCLSESEVSDIHSMPKKTFERSESGVEEFQAWCNERLTKNNIPEGTELGVVMEATGNYSLILAAWISGMFLNCIVAIADPKSVNAYGKSLKIRNKTDKTDAAILAIYGAERNPTAYIPESKEYATFRGLVRQRKAIVDMITSAKLQAQELSDIKAVINARTNILKYLNKTLVSLEFAIKKHIKEEPKLKKQAELLVSIPGVGFITAALMLGELGDVHRFSSAKKIAAFVGVSPRIHQSGKSVNGKTRMCKEGQKRIRQSLYMSALAAIKYDTNGLARFYHMLVLRKGKTKMAAIGAVMRKIICIIRRLLIDEISYNDAMVTPINMVTKNC